MPKHGFYFLSWSGLHLPQHGFNFLSWPGFPCLMLFILQASGEHFRYSHFFFVIIFQNFHHKNNFFFFIFQGQLFKTVIVLFFFFHYKQQYLQEKQNACLQYQHQINLKNFKIICIFPRYTNLSLLYRSILQHQLELVIEPGNWWLMGGD